MTTEQTEGPYYIPNMNGGRRSLLSLRKSGSAYVARITMGVVTS